MFMSAVSPATPAASQQAVVETALVLLERMGRSPADLVAAPRDWAVVPTFIFPIRRLVSVCPTGTRVSSSVSGVSDWISNGDERRREGGEHDDGNQVGVQRHVHLVMVSDPVVWCLHTISTVSASGLHIGVPRCRHGRSVSRRT
jgi:hypothetical protein